jgi:hypothetical protein
MCDLDTSPENPDPPAEAGEERLETDDSPVGL